MYWQVFPCKRGSNLHFSGLNPIFLGWFPNLSCWNPKDHSAVFSRWKKAQQCSNSANALQSYGNSSNRRSSLLHWLDWWLNPWGLTAGKNWSVFCWWLNLNQSRRSLWKPSQIRKKSGILHEFSYGTTWNCPMISHIFSHNFHWFSHSSWRKPWDFPFGGFSGEASSAASAAAPPCQERGAADAPGAAAAESSGRRGGRMIFPLKHGRFSYGKISDN